MKKVVLTMAVLILLTGWCVRFYSLNGTIKVRPQNPIIEYSMNEAVSLTDCLSYSMIKQADYDIAVVDARIVDANDYLLEIGKTSEDFLSLSERYLEITLDIVNNGDVENVFDLYGIPVLGTTWYTFLDVDATNYINGFESTGFRDVLIKASMDGHRKVKVAYRLFWKDFNTKQWNNLEDEKMWLSVTESPVSQRIAINVK